MCFPRVRKPRTCRSLSRAERLTVNARALQAIQRSTHELQTGWSRSCCVSARSADCCSCARHVSEAVRCAHGSGSTPLSRSTGAVLSTETSIDMLGKAPDADLGRGGKMAESTR
eukprot:3306456-Pleurochrysis_carterae.AAC.3